MSEPILELKQIYKKMGSRTLIEDLSFSIQPGEVFGFLGPNGAGKTTTIRMIVGLMKPTQGTVIINGYDLLKDFEKAIEHVGTIVENPELYTYLSGYQNLVHFNRMTGPVDQARINDLVKLVGLESRIHHKVKTYSLGMKQRLGVAQALLHHPSLLILDEPTNGLDPAGIREFRTLLRRLAHDEGVSVLVSSHLLSEIELMCDRVAIIQKGKLIGIENVKNLVSDILLLNVRFTVDPIENLSALSLPAEPQFEKEGNRFTVMIEREQIPAWVNQLSQAGINIYGVEPLNRTLEDRFLELTGEGTEV